MPAVTLKANRLARFLKRRLEPDVLSELLPRLGMSVEEVGDDYVKVEYNPNRPDFSSHAGIARALAGIMGHEVGLPRYRASPSRLVLRVDPSVRDVRPFIAAALIRGLKLSRDDLEELISMQEDLHWILGRNRRKVAIGLHDYSKIKPPLLYKAVGLDEVSFVPLWERREMTPREILEGTQTGRSYGYIIRDRDLAPIIIDSEGSVLSFPPIINSSLTEINEDTSEVFIDVTGTDFRAVLNTLNIISAALADMGGQIYTVKVRYKDRSVSTPIMKPKRWRVSLDEISRVIGLDVSVEEAVKALRRMRLDARRVSGGVLYVDVPAYRIDIMHPVDFSEELAMGVGFNRLAPELPTTHTFGTLRLETRIGEALREVMTGLGFTESVNTTLSNHEKEYKYLGIREDRSVKIMNPASTEYDTLRRRLLPSLLDNLASNKHNPYPQRLFELGDVLEFDENAAEMFVRKTHLACVSCHPSASYSEIKSVEEEVARALSYEISIRAKDYPFMIPGRSASLIYRDSEVGFMGEVHPQVLENFKLAMPVTALEIDLSTLDFFGNS